MSKRTCSQANRRNFLKGAGIVGAAAAVATPVAKALPAVPSEKLKAARPGPRQIAAETMPPRSDPVNQTSSGGDFMVDVLKTLDIDYLAINCASSYRGLHEADHQSRQQHKPEIITCRARGNRGPYGARLRQDGRQADRDGVPRRRRSAARHHGDVQRLVRPRAGLS